MAFGGSGGFAFGSGNNNNASTTFGFGSNNTTTNTGTSAGFGSTSTPGSFGASTTQNNPFSSNTFGSGSSGFGSNTANNASSLFGNKPATGSLFGGNNSNTSGTLFGSTNNASTGNAFGTSTGGGFGTSTNSNPFGGGGSSTTGGTAFGGFGSQTKPAFGSSATSTPLFGQGGTGTTGGFGSGFGTSGSGTGLTNQAVAPPQGTLDPPFSAVVEKASNSSQSESFQSISMMNAYNKYSFEELRLADYNAGRRFGNGQTGGAGAFGSSTFGGFGQNNNASGGFGSASTGTTLFGSTSNSGAFGSNTSTAFGSGSSGTGLFGANKTGGSLFGQQTSAPASTGLFGTSGTNNNSFGSSTFGSTNTGTSTGLFGNTQNQAKPSLFGNTATNTTSTGTGTGTGFSFGTNNNSNTAAGGSSLFGNNNQSKPSLFGSATPGGFGAATNTQNQSGGLFGTSNTTNTGSSLFNNTANSNTGSSLFGNNTQQNNATGGGGNSLFGGTTNTANRGSSLFGGTTFGNTQQQTGSTLFGNNNNNASQPGSLFGGTNNNTTGGLSFGSNNQQKPGGSLFNTGNNQSSGLFANSTNNTSFFGGSQANQQQNQQQDQFKHSSLLDPNPYGQSSIWTGLPQPNLENAKPLVTPLVATQQMKDSQSKPPPSLRLNQSRYMTPPRKSGFGFTYSTYGTPNSVASTPGGHGLTNSMYGSRFTGGSFGRSMGKAASVNGLRSQYLDGESVLSPGALTPSTARYSSGSIRRLTIDKTIRNDLFTRPTAPSLLGDKNASTHAATTAAPSTQAKQLTAQDEQSPDNVGKLKKRVSFEKDVAGGSGSTLNGETGALVRTVEEDEDDATVDGSRPALSAANGAPRGNELAVVPEDRVTETVSSKKRTISAAPEDPQPGDYWMKPTRAELKQIPREKLTKFRNFEVGRVGAGKVVFNEPVDLTSLPLDDLFDHIIEIRVRSVTVYPEGVQKPKVGFGLNVPSTISIENSWPRNRSGASSVTSGPAFERHVQRLKRIEGTTFVSYEAKTGVWTFKVPHYTRYGLDYDDDDYDDDDDDADANGDFGESQLFQPPDSIQHPKSADASVMEVDSDQYESSGLDDDHNDTFALQSQRQKTVPGGFGKRSAIDEDGEEHGSVLSGLEQDDRSERSVVSEYEASDDDDDDVNMAGSYPAPAGPALNLDSPSKPILKPGGPPGTPGRALLDFEGDWAEQLQRTISPRKQNRDALREAQSKVLLDRAYEPIKPSVRKNEFRSSIDVMNAIFGNEQASRSGRRSEAEPVIEFPSAKRVKSFDKNAPEKTDPSGHTSFKPTFTGQGQFVCRGSSQAPETAGWTSEVLLATDSGPILINSLKDNGGKLDLASLMSNASISLANGVPKIEYRQLSFSLLRKELHLAAGQQDALGKIFELLHVLFDVYEDEFNQDLSGQQRLDFEARVRKDRLSKFLAANLASRAYPLAHVNDAAGAAFQHLTAHNIQAACDTLAKAKNFNLAMLVAQIESADATFQQDMAEQIVAWKEQDVIGEMTEEIRSLYALLSGNTTICQGKQDGPAENRASSFLMSEKYGLDWLQAFALCLWYGKAKNGNVEDVVEDFEQKISQGGEMASPVAADGQQDPLWVVLKLFASGRKPAAVPAPRLPTDFESLSKPFDASGTFTLFQAVTARGLLQIHPQEAQVDATAADRLAADLAFQLEARDDLVAAAWALTHISDDTARRAMISDLLYRQAGKTELRHHHQHQTSEPSQDWARLTQTLRIPEAWIYRAKALYCRSTHARFEELHFLLLAEDWDEAHACFCDRVAGRLVIDEDYHSLSAIIAAFGAKPEERVTGWLQGGLMYADFATLVSNKNSNSGSPAAYKAALRRLWSTLSEARTTRTRTRTRTTSHLSSDPSDGKNDISAGGLEALEQRVGLREMSVIVADLFEGQQQQQQQQQQQGGGGKEVLSLPLTHSEMKTAGERVAREYYAQVMAG